MDLSTATTPNASIDTRRPDYQALKTHVHRQLLGVLDLNRLPQIRREDSEP